MIYDELEYFSADEFAHPWELSKVLLRMLDSARGIAGIPIHPTSDFRPGDPKTHGRGEAIDFACVGSQARWKYVFALKEAGFRRIGIYDKHIHVDVSVDEVQDVMWWGVSK